MNPYASMADDDGGGDRERAASASSSRGPAPAPSLVYQSLRVHADGSGTWRESAKERDKLHRQARVVYEE